MYIVPERIAPSAQPSCELSRFRALERIAPRCRLWRFLWLLGLRHPQAAQQLQLCCAVVLVFRVHTRSHSQFQYNSENHGVDTQPEKFESEQPEVVGAVLCVSQRHVEELEEGTRPKRERERERVLLGTTVHNGGSRAAPATWERSESCRPEGLGSVT